MACRLSRTPSSNPHLSLTLQSSRLRSIAPVQARPKANNSQGASRLSASTISTHLTAARTRGGFCPPIRPSGVPVEVLRSALVLTLCGGICLVWLYTTPFHGAPDEAAHFHVLRFIREHGRLPVFQPGEMWVYHTQEGAVESYATYPPLTYLAASVVHLPFTTEPFWEPRAISFVSYLGTVLVVYLTARAVAPAAPAIAVLASLVVGLLPQFTFTGSYFNNDGLLTLETSLLIYVMTRLARAPSVPVVIMVGTLIGSLLLSKYTGYPIALVSLLTALVLVWRWRRPLVGVPLLVGPIVTLAGWWFMRNWVLYRELIPGEIVASAKAAEGGNSLFVAAKHQITLGTLLLDTDFWPLTLKSFVATFGFLTVFLDPWMYAVCVLGAMLSLAGVVIRLATAPVSRGSLTMAVVGSSMVAVTVLSAMAISVYGEWSPQGRYLFPALAPIALFLSAGWYWLAARTGGIRWLLLPAIGLVGLNVVSLYGYVVPAYFGGEARRVVVQVDQLPPPGPGQAAVKLTGWAIEQGRTSWRPLDPEIVAGYRGPVDGVSVYVDGLPGQTAAVGRATTGVRRRDVMDYFGQASRLERVGWEFTLPFDGLGRGRHLVYVCGSGGRTPSTECASRTIEVPSRG